MIERGYFYYTIIPFGIKNAPRVFSRIVVVVVKEFIHKILEVYMDDWIDFSLLKYHIQLLQLMLERFH